MVNEKEYRKRDRLHAHVADWCVASGMCSKNLVAKWSEVLVIQADMDLWPYSVLSVFYNS